MSSEQRVTSNEPQARPQGLMPALDVTPRRPGLKPGLSRNLYAAACFMASYALLTGHRLLLVAHG